MNTIKSNSQSYSPKKFELASTLKNKEDELKKTQIQLENEQFQLATTREILDGSQIDLPCDLKALINDLKFEIDTLQYPRSSLYYAECSLLLSKEHLGYAEERYQSEKTLFLTSQKQYSAAQKTLIDLENQFAEATAELPKVTDQLSQAQHKINDRQLVLTSVNNQLLANRAAAEDAHNTCNAAKEQLSKNIAARKKPQEDYVKAKNFPGDTIIQDEEMQALTANYEKLHAQVVKGYDQVAEAQELEKKTRNTLIASEKEHAARQAELTDAQHTHSELQNKLQEIQRIIAAAPTAIPQAKEKYEVIETQLKEDEDSLLIAEKELEAQKTEVASYNTAFLKAKEELSKAIAKIGEIKKEILQLQIELQASAKSEIQNLETQLYQSKTDISDFNSLLLQKETDISDLKAELKTKDEYTQFANVIRPIVALAAGATSLYFLLNNPSIVINGVNLFCRTVSTDITIDTLNALSNGYAIEIATVIGTLTAYTSAHLFAPAILYSTLKSTNAIIDLVTKTPIYLLKTTYAYRNLLLLSAIAGLMTYYNPSLMTKANSIHSTIQAQILEVIPMYSELIYNTFQYGSNHIHTLFENIA